MADYKVQFEVFEGPLDLLLYLVKKEEVDICDVDLTMLATQFIEHVKLMRELDLDIAGEFLVMAATLMYIKSRELLPKDQQVTPDGEEDEEDPRWELIRKLVEYKKFKDVAARLQERELAMEDIYPRIPGKPDLVVPPPRTQVSLFDLLNAVNLVLKRHAAQDVRDIFEDKWTVSEKIELLRRLIEERGSIKFTELFATATSRTEIVVTFLALLELMRLRFLVAVQEHAFAEIELVRALEPASAGAASPETKPEPAARDPVLAPAGGHRHSL
jgi:segregation and condensation protein A